MSASLSRILLPVTVAGLLALAVGCQHPHGFDAARTGPLFTPVNFRGEQSLGAIQRVAVLPVWGGSTMPMETAAELDATVVTALQQQRRFEVVTVSREWLRRLYRAESFSSASALPHGLMTRLQSELAAEAVLFVDVTVYQAYRPLGIGLRAKLATIEEPRLLWSFDELFQADQADVANAARNHFVEQDERLPVDLTHGALQSPSRFAAYATAAMFATLPPVLPPMSAVVPAR